MRAGGVSLTTKGASDARSFHPRVCWCLMGLLGLTALRVRQYASLGGWRERATASLRHAPRGLEPLGLGFGFSKVLQVCRGFSCF